MEHRTFLLGLLGGLAASPAIIAASSSTEAASVPGSLPPVSQPEPEPVSSSTEAEVDLNKVDSDWSQWAYRRVYRRAYYPGTYRRRARRVYRRAYSSRYYY